MNSTDKEYTLVIFDLDGTITDSQKGIVKSLEYSFEKMGRKDLLSNNLGAYIGRALDDIYMETLNTDEKSVIDEAINHYRDRFAQIGMFENTLYAGMASLLKTLHDKGIYIALASIKPALYSNEILRYFDIMGYFSYTVGSSIDGRHANKGELIDIVMRNFRVTDNSKCIMIGDRKGDIEGAINNDIDSIAVLYGYGEETELKQAGPTYMARDVEGIREIIIKPV